MDIVRFYMSTKLKTWKFGFKVTATVHYFPVCEMKKKKEKKIIEVIPAKWNEVISTLKRVELPGHHAGNG